MDIIVTSTIISYESNGDFSKAGLLTYYAVPTCDVLLYISIIQLQGLSANYNFFGFLNEFNS